MNSYAHILSSIEPKEILPGFNGRFIHTENLTLAFWEIKEGSKLPEHAHIHEQVAHLIEGRFELVINGKAHMLDPGSVACIPSGAVHSGKAVTNCKILDVFTPVREDYKL